MPVIHWFRRDLRLEDNTALNNALMSEDPVVPLFILDDYILDHDIEPGRLAALHAALLDLDARLRDRGSRLLVRRGDAAREMNHVAEETEAWGVYFNRDYTPYARQRDTRATRGLQMTGVVTQVFDDALLVPPFALDDQQGEALRNFEVFAERWLAALDVDPEPLADPPGALLAPASTVPDSVPDWQLRLPDPAGHQAATAGGSRDSLRAFVAEALVGFDAPDLEAPETASLAEAMRIGTLSPRDAARGALRRGAADARSRPAVETFFRALAQREFVVHRRFADPTGQYLGELGA
jgi:deoxyribodipyrimidine photo-lyase